MTDIRIKSVVRNIVEKSDGAPQVFIGLEDIESGTGRLLVEDLPLKAADDSIRHNPGDVLFCKLRPYLAKSYLPKGQGTGTSELLVLRPGPRIDARFLLYVTLSTPWLEWANTTAYGTKMPRTSWELVGNYRTWLPPVEEQWRIADFLDAETARIDQICLLSKKQVAALRESVAEGCRAYTTGKTGPTRATGIPWMPWMSASWRLHKVGHHFITGSGTTPASTVGEYFDGPYPWVNSADIRDGRVCRAERSVTDKALTDYSSLQIHPAGSLVVAMYGQGETKGRTGILAMDSTVNQACCVMKSIGGLRVDYLHYWFVAHKSGVVNLAVGAGQPNLSQELIRQLRIPAPGLKEQEGIVDTLRESEHDARHRIERLEARGRLLAERRQALITAAVTGQLDVTTARPAHNDL